MTTVRIPRFAPARTRSSTAWRHATIAAGGADGAAGAGEENLHIGNTLIGEESLLVRLRIHHGGTEGTDNSHGEQVLVKKTRASRTRRDPVIPGAASARGSGARDRGGRIPR